MADVSIERIEGSAENPRLNVVFVHGLGGDARGTWTFDETPLLAKAVSKAAKLLPKFLWRAPEKQEPTGTFWPEWLAEDMPGLAVYSLNYPSDPKRWKPGWAISQSAVAVLDALMVNRLLRGNSASIVFVCHSLGGLIVKKLIVTANIDKGQEPAKGAFLDRIAGVAFLATPHGGSFLATLAREMHWVVSDSLRELDGNGPELLHLANSYRSMIEDEGRRIAHRVYYEDEKVAGVKVVDARSADPGLTGVRPVAILRDHFGICKMQEKDQVYEGVLALLEDALKPRPPSTRNIVEGVEDKLDALPKEMIDGLLAALDARGVTGRAQDEGLERGTVIALARRLKPGEPLDFDRAVIELENAVAIAQDVIAKGARGTNEDEFVNAVLARVGELTKKGEFDKGAKEIDAALAQQEQQEAERRDAYSRSRIALLDAGIRQDIIRRDFKSAASRVAQVVDLDQMDRAARFASLRKRWEAYYVEGRDKGLNASLEISIEIARIALSRACDADERGAAGIDLGAALSALGERESGTGKLEEALAAYREALKEWTRERVPLQWATTQNNLGNALARLGVRESGTGRLEEAVSAYREALKERTRERVPLDWAMTQNNLGEALRVIGEQESGTGKLEEAVSAFREVLKEWTRERVPLPWAGTQNNLGAALARLGVRESGQEKSIRKLEEAVSAFREALKEYLPERVPLDWAMTQTNLGNALSSLGQRESGTGKLEEAVAAFHDALKEYTRERVPLNWATSTGNQSVALMLLAERRHDAAMAAQALAQIEAAFETCRDGGHARNAAIYEALLPQARALAERLKGR